MKLVSIITVNFNQPKVTEDLLQSILKINTYRDTEVIVVDNGSNEDPVPGWQRKYPDFIFVRSDTNEGFAGGNNIGMKYARGEYLFLINNDTEVTPDLITLLSDSLTKNPEVGVVSPKIHYFDQPGKLQYAGYTPMNYMLARNKCVGQFEDDHGQYDGASGKTGYAHGAAMMIRREAMEKAGVMAENYFLYFEELDWCERIRNAGYGIHTNLRALIYHKESISVGKRSALKEYFMTRNRILFIRKNAPGITFYVFCAYFSLVVIPRSLLRYLINGELGYVPVFFRAIRWHFSNRTDSPNLGYSSNP